MWAPLLTYYHYYYYSYYYYYYYHYCPTDSCISQLGYTLANQDSRAPACMRSTWHPTFLPLRAEMWEPLFELQAGCSLPSIFFRNNTNHLKNMFVVCTVVELHAM